MVAHVNTVAVDTSSGAVASSMLHPYLINYQLFSQAYLRDLQSTLTQGEYREGADACRQTIREWRQELPVLDDPNDRLQYVGQCLSSLGLFYGPLDAGDGFILYADSTRLCGVGLCLIVDDDNLGRTTKGCHYQARLVRELRRASLAWGIVTNGTRWRLAHAIAAAPYEESLEVDLDALLDLNESATAPGRGHVDVERLYLDFALFYHHFGAAAFTLLSSQDSGMVRVGLDSYAKESERRIEAIQRYLRGRVESILQSLCLGFVQDEAASSYTRETLDEVYRNAIYLLYRVLFLFYAEARGLLPMANQPYHVVSLARTLEEARRRQQEGAHSNPDDPYALWKQLSHLCVIVDQGDESVGVSPYNGGLFSDEEKPYLKSHKIVDAYLAPALYELGYMLGKGGAQPIDYRDLSVRQLGTLYEGLLEYRLNLVDDESVVVREGGGKRTYVPVSSAGMVKKGETILEVGQVYFADDKGERKASGSYYTPEDVVRYIVDNTVTPALRERCASIDALHAEVRTERAIAATPEERERLERYGDRKAVEIIEREVLGLRILDLAMGSAHFLTATGQLVTNTIVETLEATEWPDDSISTDPLLWKRRVAERCLYGVDLNPLAQELAKLALWLSSASANKPLTFLDHHLKVGNSLYGAPMARLSRLPVAAGKAKARKGGNGVEGNDLFGLLREQTIKVVLGQLSKITGGDSDRIEDVRRKGEANRSATAYLTRLRDIANVWLGSLYALDGEDGKPLDEQGYERLLQDATPDDAPESWESYVQNNVTLRQARALAEAHDFFHWEVEFPDAIVDGRCQFDVIVGNPPYVGTSPNRVITTLFDTAKCGDLYAWILERALRLTTALGQVGMIVPLSVMFSRSFTYLRDALLNERAHLSLSCYDNIPDSLFNSGKTSENTNRENSQRTTIVLVRRASTTKIEVTDLLRWTHQERPKVFTTLHFTDVTDYCSRASFPKIGNEKLVHFYNRLLQTDRRLADLAAEIFSESQRPDLDTLFLTVPRVQPH